MKIVYTIHARGKFAVLRKEGWKFSPKDIRETVQKAYFSETDEERGVQIAIKRWDQRHDLRVIYKEEDAIIVVVTFYPTEKGRYVK